MELSAEIHQFLKQQVELYGDELAVERQLRLADRGEASAGYHALEMGSAQVERTYTPPAHIREKPPAPDLQVSSLEELRERMAGCVRCAIGTQRNNLVFGAGNPAADIVLIGEAPGFTEDQKGEPFVGEAGQLLTKILAAIKLERSEVYICNLLKCRPANNRDPLPDEVENCLPFLEKQLELIQPAFILCLGRFAAQTLLQTSQPLSQLRGKVHDRKGARLIVTYHPAALLRYPKFKTETWQDVQLLRRLYDQFLAENLPR